MHAILLAAGVGRRLGQADGRPKCLLEFGGRSLLSRHCENLRACGVDTLTLCLGYGAEHIVSALAAESGPTTLVHYNPLPTLGSILSLWYARAALASGDDVLVMDADVLYHPDILRRLIKAPAADCWLMDRDFVPGDEPVKICTRAGTIVEFRKRLAEGLEYDAIGESVGFFKFSPTTALALARLVDAYVADGRREAPHEEALRDLALGGEHAIGIEDVSGLPWLEIDFPEDLLRARDDVLPRIEAR
ncbi:MAG: NTP transferase domain-containing protein [Gammaproteobacteria bacterium]